MKAINIFIQFLHYVGVLIIALGLMVLVKIIIAAFKTPSIFNF